MTPGWQEVWRHRYVLYLLAVRDIKVRYKQTLIGAGWAVLQPLMMMALFSIVFGRLAGFEAQTEGVPYPIYTLAALLLWLFFANSVAASANSIVGSAHLVTKVYFPRLIIPLASLGPCLVDLGVSLIVLLGMMAYYGILPTPQWLLAPVFGAAAALAAGGAGAMLAALTASYRDFRHVVPFALQLWMFATPVVYPLSLVPEEARWMVALNPMTGIIEGFRASVLGTRLPWEIASLSLAVSATMFLIGTAYFRTVERSLADVI